MTRVLGEPHPAAPCELSVTCPIHPLPKMGAVSQVRGHTACQWSCSQPGWPSAPYPLRVDGVCVSGRTAIVWSMAGASAPAPISWSSCRWYDRSSVSVTCHGSVAGSISFKPGFCQLCLLLQTSHAWAVERRPGA